MNTLFEYKNNSFQITRYPSTNNRSLQAWNAADEYLLQKIEEMNLEKKSIAIFNDRFGFLTCLLHDFLPISIIDYSSQEKSILQNSVDNSLNINHLEVQTILSDFPKKINLGIFKIPKSMDLFRLQLFQLHSFLENESVVLCGFMTKYFTPQMLKIAGEFFEEIEQSKAWKKSRVLILKKKKKVEPLSFIHSIPFQGEIFQQYFGVFSAKNIDYASQFLIEHLKLKAGENRILDLASGNGVLAKMIRLQNADCEIHLLDDSWLAVESSKLNFQNEPSQEAKNENTFFHFNNSLEIFENDFFDLVVSNPPFHFEYETNIEVAIRLFEEVKVCLKKGGRFLLVANRHLNYKTHLDKIFDQVEAIAENEKYVVYECFKVIA